MSGSEIHLLLSVDEYQAIDTAAQLEDMTPAAFARRAALRAARRVLSQDEYAEVDPSQLHGFN